MVNNPQTRRHHRSHANGVLLPLESPWECVSLADNHCIWTIPAVDIRPLISNHLRSHSDKNTLRPGTAPSLVSPLVTCILYPALGYENNLTAQQPKQVSSRSSRKRTRRLGCTGCLTCIRVAGTHLPAESHIESHVIRLMKSSWASFEIDCYAVSRRWCDTWRLHAQRNFDDAALILCRDHLSTADANHPSHTPTYR